MADASEYAGNIKQYTREYNQRAAEKIVGHLGIALRKPDSRIVACSQAAELQRVREKWCRSKLGLAHSNAELDSSIQLICEKMKADGARKSRVTFYYLLAEHFDRLDLLAS